MKLIFLPTFSGWNREFKGNCVCDFHSLTPFLSWKVYENMNYRTFECWLFKNSKMELQFQLVISLKCTLLLRAIGLCVEDDAIKVDLKLPPWFFKPKSSISPLRKFQRWGFFLKRFKFQPSRILTLKSSGVWNFREDCMNRSWFVLKSHWKIQIFSQRFGETQRAIIFTWSRK